MKNNTIGRYSRTLFIGALLVTGALRPESSTAEVIEDPLLDDANPVASVCPIESPDSLSMLVGFLDGAGIPINGCPDKTADPKTKCDTKRANENLDGLERRLCNGAKELLLVCQEDVGPCIKCKKGEDLPSSANAKCKRKTEKPTPDCGPLTRSEDGSEQYCVTVTGRCTYKCD